MKFKSISVIGLGYIGLPTAAVFASKGVNVIGVDINEETVNTVNRGEIHIVEPGLERLVKKVVNGGLLSATTHCQHADAYLLTVPTPFNYNSGQPDLTFVEAASQKVAEVLKPGDLVILESTSPVGTTEKIARWMAAKRPDLTFPQTHGETSDIRIAYCPERVLPGRVIEELQGNDRVVGGMTPKCAELASSLYEIFVRGKCHSTNPRVAEMVKLTENTFRDVNIALANELSIICDNLGIDVWELIILANRHPRVDILQPGPGVGGHCIAVDPWFIISQSAETAKLIRTARDVNDSKPDWVVEKIKREVADFLFNNPERTSASVSIACFGLAFKADIDDLRESPALAITRNIASGHPGKVYAVEPNIKFLTAEDAELFDLVNLEEACAASDIFVFLVDHAQFKSIKEIDLVGKRVLDTKGLRLRSEITK